MFVSFALEIAAGIIAGVAVALIVSWIERRR